MMYRWTAVLTSLTAFAAYAHTPLKATVPAADAAVAAPKAVELEFNGEVRLTALTLKDSAGREKHLDALPTAIASKFALAVHEPLARGEHTVVWRAVGGDTHVVSGEYRFTVQ